MFSCILNLFKMAKQKLELVPKPPDSRLLYLECKERESGKISSLQELFRGKTNAYLEEGSSGIASVLFAEIFTAQRRLMGKNLQGMRVLVDGFSDGMHSKLASLLSDLDMDVVSLIMGVTRGQYAAEMEARFDVATTVLAVVNHFKSMPDITVTSGVSKVERDIYTFYNASLSVSGDPRIVASVYRVMGENFGNLKKARRGFNYVHSIAFST